MNYLSPKKMPEPVFEKIEIRFVPSFSHLALVKVALPLFYKYGSDMLNAAMTTIQVKNQPGFSGFQEKWTLKFSRAQEELMFIPAHLRRRVIEGVNAIECEVNRWRKDHFFLRLQEEDTKCMEEDVVFWKSDGTISYIETAEKLVFNKNISIGVRFQLACKYCFMQIIKTLWAEIVSSGKSENYQPNDDSVESGWIEWMQNGSPADWTPAVLRQSWPPLRCNSFFWALQPEVRKEALAVIKWSTLNLDDFHLCLCEMTPEEQHKVVKRDVVRFLFLFLQWPLQGFFLEMVKRVKIYVDYQSFLGILSYIFGQMCLEIFDYSQFLVGICNIFPEHYQDLLKFDPDLSNAIHQYVERNRFPKILYVGPRRQLRLVPLDWFRL